MTVRGRVLGVGCGLMVVALVGVLTCGLAVATPRLSAGTRGIGGAHAAAAPLPPLPVSMRASHTLIWEGTNPDLTAHLDGDPSQVLADLQIATQGDRSFRTVETDHFDSSGNIRYGVEGPGWTINRNMSFRVMVHSAQDTPPRQPSYSNTVEVEVLPKLYINASQELRYVPDHNPDMVPNGYFDFAFEVAAVRPAGKYHPEREFLYVRRGSRGRFRLLVSRMIPRWVLGGSLRSPRARLHLPRFTLHGVQFLVCISHQLLPEMGNPFHDAACGRHSLTSGGPLGARSVLRRVRGDLYYYWPPTYPRTR